MKERAIRVIDWLKMLRRTSKWVRWGVAFVVFFPWSLVVGAIVAKTC